MQGFGFRALKSPRTLAHPVVDVMQSLRSNLARRAPPLSGLSPAWAGSDGKLADLLDDIQREEAPERLLALARELQRQLILRKQRENPN